MSDLLIAFISYFTQLLAIMNPFSAIPTFISLTEGMSHRERVGIVRKAYLAGLIILMAFTLVGKYILEAFHVSIPGLRVGGGIILLTIALDMLGEMPRTKQVNPGDIAVVPIATPLIIGPGTITTVLLLTSSDPSVFNIGMVFISGIVACTATFAILMVSDKLVAYLKLSTVRAIGRFMAIIIAGVAVEMIANGVYQYYVQFFMQ
ncbi:MAG: MarC family protein [Thermosphaera aggregans]|jgi:multiple antibiotic resistance protein|uniref:MarC family protein n=1 Tax=Thermosphaera aggregans TaxID=54254 RepID=UPI003C10FB94